MLYGFDRPSRAAAMTALAAALIWVPLAVTPANAGSSDGASLQLAQASRQGGAKSAAPAPSGGSEVDKQIADLKKQLKITPQQEPQFNAFAEVMRSNAQELDAQMSKGSANPNAVEELKQVGVAHFARVGFVSFWDAGDLNVAAKFGVGAELGGDVALGDLHVVAIHLDLDVGQGDGRAAVMAPVSVFNASSAAPRSWSTRFIAPPK